jgi:hypothetical protein
MNIYKLSETDDKANFIYKFSQVQKDLYEKTDRLISDPNYWSYLLELFSYKQKELILIEEDNKIIGRVCVNETQADQDAIIFGMLEYPEHREDICHFLLRECEKWGRSKSKNKLVGPIDITVWFGNRFRHEDYATQYTWEPTNPKSYLIHCQNYGLNVDHEYLTCFYTTFMDSFERTQSAYHKALKEGYSFRNLDLSRDSEIDILYDLNTLCFQKNYFYEPITKDEYIKTHIQATKHIDLKYSFFVLDENQKEIGYVFSFVDHGLFVVKSILMNPKTQGARLASSLVHRSLMVAKDDGLSEVCGAMVRKGNISQHFFDHLGVTKETHEYSMLSKSL